MNRKMAITTLLVLAILATGMFITRSPLLVGVYDPANTINSENITHELIYFGWGNDTKQLHASTTKVIDKGRIPIVTVEPWNMYREKNVLKNIAQGSYDNLIDTVCADLVSQQTPIIFRFAHEMDIKKDRYPWSEREPKEYIDAYTHVVLRCKQIDTNKRISYMWSPSGDDKAPLYYPGNNVVDLIGVSVYSYDTWDNLYLGHTRTFTEIFDSKYERLVSFNKPIWIAEMGVTGTPAEKQTWMKDMKQKAYWYRHLIGYVYFNSIDTPNVWGSDVPTPDWVIETL